MLDDERVGCCSADVTSIAQLLFGVMRRAWCCTSEIAFTCARWEALIRLSFRLRESDD